MTLLAPTFEIPLTRGRVAVADVADRELLSGYRWYALEIRYPNKVKFYAAGRRIGDRKDRVYMHRLVFGALKHQEVDHENGNGLDNRRDNLRLCSRSQNNCNRDVFHGTNIYRGVTLNKRGGRNPWWARVRINGIAHHVGSFPTAELAAKARDAAAISLQGEFCRTNFSKETAGAA